MKAYTFHGKVTSRDLLVSCWNAAFFADTCFDPLGKTNLCCFWETLVKSSGAVLHITVGVW